ncbi:MAG: NlpC/P60 family protein [Actinophytocola sp.]|nr:NlpC/P60 family protein [Actinophytocola sp.]
MRDQPLAGETVELQRNTGSGWSVADNEKTDSEGKVEIPAEITETADWRLSYDGDPIHDPDNSETERVESIEPVDEQIVAAAAAQEGDPYSYGSAGPDSFDCSGLTQYAHEQAGVELPRTSSEQRDALDEVPQSEKKPGDLLFFADGGSVYHVGIYAGDNEIWHAPQDGETVHRKELWTDDYTVGRAW